jgi:hypothetical protein
MFASTSERVRRNTDCAINDQIRRQTESNVACYEAAGPDAIDRRLAELEQEWDIERCVETMAPTFSLIGLWLGITVNRKWLALPIVIQAFFLQHALQGWCPPIPLLRRLGVRTMEEIQEERFALKALRGDFRPIDELPGAIGDDRGRLAIAAARR